MRHTERKGCPFCEQSGGDVVTADNELAAAFPDGFPLSEGHTLVVPKRHVSDFFQLTTDEQEAVLEIAREVQSLLKETYEPDGFNVGINCGEAAGQTVGHAHLHVIPRFSGDVEDPRGGVRWVLPEGAEYWTRLPEEDQ